MKISTKAKIRNMYVRMTDILHCTRFARRGCLSQENSKNGLEHVEGCPEYKIELCQPFKPSPTLESKKHNLTEAAQRINGILVRPGEIFSFWHIVGNPNNRKRFQEGRSIHNGVLSIDVGGGLCQASGIIHHLALLAGLEILERYNHSVDLYTDETRFAPLGTDATVFYGFKDLRLKNTLPYPIAFELIVEENQLRAILKSSSPITSCNLIFDIKTDDKGKKHVTITTKDGKIISKSTYSPIQ